MAIDGISSNGQGSYPMLDIDDAIAKARAMMARQEEANRDLRHTSEKLREAETAERIDLMHDAADVRHLLVHTQVNINAVELAVRRIDFRVRGTSQGQRSGGGQEPSAHR